MRKRIARVSRDQATWTAMDELINVTLAPTDAALKSTLQASTQAGLRPIHVSPSQGKLLMLLAKSIHARSILEIGTLGGYSTIFLARALPRNGRLVTLEIDAKTAEVARQNLARANLAEVVEVRLGRALDTLPELA